MRKKPAQLEKAPRVAFNLNECARDIGAACTQTLGATGALYVLLCLGLLGLGMINLMLDFLPNESGLRLGAASTLAMLGAFVNGLRG